MHFDVSFQVSDRALPANFGKVQTASDGGYERGYAKGYGEGETAAKAEAEAHNEEILTNCNTVLLTKGAETAETLEQVPQRIGEVQSYSEGYDVGLEAGKKSEYDRFWDEYLSPPGYITWGYRFAGIGWNDRTFNPPADIVPTGSATMMFAACGITDLKALCNKSGIVIDFSKATSFSQIFSDCNITHVGVIDTRSASNANYILFNATNMVTVDKIILKSDGSQTFTNGFNSTRSLQNIVFEGVIGKSISFPLSVLLTDVSVQSIIDHLADLTGQTAQTLTFHATVGGTLTAEQKATITAKNWTLVY